MTTSRREFITMLVAGIGLAVAGLDEAVAAKAGEPRTAEDMLFALEVGDPIHLTYAVIRNIEAATAYTVAGLADTWDDHAGTQQRVLTLAETDRRHVTVSITIQRRWRR